eukprot:gene10602-7545_t
MNRVATWMLPAIDVAFTNATQCSQLSSCSSCTSIATLDCSWCATTKNCVSSSSSKAGACSAQLIGGCSDSYYTIIFLILLISMMCICCATCYWRRTYGQNEASELTSPLVNNRHAILGDRTGEWVCVICGFDNNARSSYCILCGETHQFSQDYKLAKREERRQRSLMHAVSGVHSNPLQRSVVTSTVPPAPRPSLASQGPRSSSQTTAEMERVALPPEGRGDIDIPIPEDAQISSVSMSLRNFDVVTGAPRPSLATGGNGAVAAPAVLSEEQRQQAINCRRINQLTLRQKSARRRKLWQRRYDPATQSMVWARVPIRETKVGNAPFGYTPRHSISESRRAPGGEQSANQSVFSLLSSSIHFGSHSYNQMTQEDEESAAIQDLLSAARSGDDDRLLGDDDEDDDDDAAGEAERNRLANGATSIAPGTYAPPTGALAAPQPPSTPQRQPRRPFTSPGRIATFFQSLRLPGTGRKGDRRWSKDSFDSAVASTSPGFASVFDEEGGLTWQRVESGMPVSRNHYGGSVARPAATATSASAASAAAALQSPVADTNDAVAAATAAGPAFDLPTVAAFTFREKQVWFLDRIGELQKPWTDGFVKMEVRRAKLLGDSHRAWSQLRDEDLHKWFRFQFSNEPGIDAGGLEREWFTLVMEEVFAPSAGLFLACSSAGAAGSNVYHLNPISGAINPDHLSYFRFIGRVLGKALMAQQSIRANLSLPLRKQIIGSPVTFSDLEFVDDELYRNLLWMKTQTLEGNADVIRSLDLDFSISYTAANQTVTYDLVEGGSLVAVTADNLDEYLQLRLRHRLLDSVKLQLEHLLRGLYEIVPPEWLSVFDYQELDLLLCGVPELDVADWQANTEYLGEYRRLGARHPVVRWFWAAVAAMSNEERIRLLQFTTGCGRLPVQGFKALQSSDGRYRKFNIQSIAKTDSKYPRAHTCFNKLDLPLYDTQAELESFLSYVIHMDVTGFTME